MGKLKQIIDGWKSYLIDDPIALEKAKQRAKVCAECDKPKKMFIEIIKDDDIQEIEGFKCSVCNCPLSTATRSKEYTCPLGKW